MFRIRKLNVFNLWMLVDPHGNYFYARTWERCMDYANSQIFYNFYFENAEVAKRYLDE